MRQRTQRCVRLGIPVALVLAVSLDADVRQQPANPAGAPRRFEVASVKRNYIPDLVQRSRLTTTPGRFTATNYSLRSLIKYAYSVTDREIIGGPDWMDSPKFDIQAGAPGVAAVEMRPLVQRLLADRFGLMIRKETRTRPIYRLVRARDDGKLPKGLTPDSCPETTDPEHPPACNTVAGGPSTLMGVFVSMERFAKLLYSFPYTEVDRYVVDATGLEGTYRFQMQFASTREYEGLRKNDDPNAPAFMTALQEQVGLKLQPSTGPVEVLIIQSARRPDGD